MTGVPEPSVRLSARSIVPSPPSTTTRSAFVRSPSASRSCFSASSSGKSRSTPSRRAISSSRASASPVDSGWPCVRTATVRTRSADGMVDPVVELIGQRGMVAVDEVQEELPVPLGAGQARVYDPHHLCRPRERGFRDLAKHSTVDLAVAHDTALPDVLTPRLELGLDEDERLPAGTCQREGRWEGGADADERDVADDQLRGE